MDNSFTSQDGANSLSGKSESFAVLQPDSQEVQIPLLIDSPHSGRDLPEGFSTSAPNNAMMSGWDAWIEDLYGDCCYFGATLMHQHISRMVIDLNRKHDDIHPDLIAGLSSRKSQAFNPTEYSGRGMGLIRQFALPGIPISERKLTIEELEKRITDFYQPYHNRVESLLKGFKQRFGMAWHINCHSMKSVGNAMNVDAGQPRADVVLSDRDGATGDPEFMAVIANSFTELGYQVALNNPYKGGYLVQAYSNPASQIYSMQIELNRALYMDEQHFSQHSGYESLKRDINSVLNNASNYIKQLINN